MDQATLGYDPNTVVVTEAVLQPGGVWYLRIRLPDGRLVRLAMPARIATPAVVQISALATAALVTSGMVTA